MTNGSSDENAGDGVKTIGESPEKVNGVTENHNDDDGEAQVAWGQDQYDKESEDEVVKHHNENVNTYFSNNEIIVFKRENELT
jgi:hypothetical protein